MFELKDFITIGFLIFLEGILSIDNAVVLALLAKPLPKELRKKALTYGIIGAVVFRLIALALATHLMRWTWVKFVGGGYLLYVGLHHFWKKSESHEAKGLKASAPSFWKTVAVIELTDIAFAVDSILAAVAVSPKFWVVFTGGVIGLILLRFAATFFITLLDKFPGFETTAYLLIVFIGTKLVIDGFKFEGVDFHSSHSPAFWVFWGLSAAAILYGFTKRPKPKSS